MTTMSPLPEDAPVMIAWERYKETDEAKNSRRWAMNPDYVDGALWAAFSARFDAGHIDRSDPVS